jgi:alpha-galactosidase
MTSSEAQAQFSLWAIVAAPLILGSDPRALAPETIRMLENRQVIAVDQDPLGIQGTAVQQEGSAEVWSKPLSGERAAVALLNRGTVALQITTSASKAGLRSAAHYTVHDLWAGTTETTTGEISALVPPESVVLYRVTPGRWHA